MSLRYKFKQADKLIAGLNPGERIRLGDLCRHIQRAETHLLKAAEDILNDCGKRCQGLCCRNIHIDDIMTLLDCIHIVATAAAVRPAIDEALIREGLYSADCIFLKGGVGPCLFPSDARPEKCILSFCRGDGIVGAEMRQVRKSFNRLARFIYFQKPRAVMRFLFASSSTGQATVTAKKGPAEP